MSVSMGVSSRREPPELLGSPVPKKRAWGADAQQLMQSMVNQLQQSPSETSELTLDLLGNADPSASSPSSQHQLSPEFLHLDTLPLPSGWEKCLDLQTGELYFVNKSLGVSSFSDPRKRQRTRSRDFYNPNCRQPAEIEHPTAAVLQLQQQQHQEEESPQVAHEFLASKKSETESLNLKGGQGAAATVTVATPAGYSTSSYSSGSPPLRRRNGSRIRTALPSSSSKQQQQQQQQQQQHHWSSQQHRINYTSTTTTTTSSRGAVTVVEDSNLELDLNLSAGGGMGRRSSSPRTSPQTVCTVEMIQNALRRSSEKTLTVKREAFVAPGRLGSSSFSSLTNSTTRSEPSAASPATSSSSSASSRSGAGLKTLASAGVFEAESIKVERVMEPGTLIMGACTRCLMYVMLNKADPRCPRCDSKVSVDFASPCKKGREGLKLGLGSN